MFNPTRDQVRQFFCQTWRKYRERAILVGAEAIAAEIIVQHPEYHRLLEDPAALAQEFTPEQGRTNPFLHLALHLAIAEQVSIDQPAGIRACHEKLCRRHDAHDAEHALLECLGEAIWYAQRNGTAIDENAYLRCLHRAARTSSSSSP